MVQLRDGGVVEKDENNMQTIQRNKKDEGLKEAAKASIKYI